MADNQQPDPNIIKEANKAMKEFNNLILQGKFGNEDISKSLQKQLDNYDKIVDRAKSATTPSINNDNFFIIFCLLFPCLDLSSIDLTCFHYFYLV